MGDDRFKAALARFIRDTVPTAFLRLVRGRVVAVDGAAVDTDPETPGAPQLTGLPTRYGVPGVLRAVCKAGARAVVAWAEGDPSQPFVLAWDPGELEELVFDVAGGAQPLARTGDAADCGHLIVAAGSVVGYLPPGTPVPSLPVGQSAIALSGTITGTSKVQA